MVDPIPPKVKKVWDRWNIRGTILFSLSLQVFLVLIAPYRKCTRKRLLILLLWSAYLLADAAANFTVGLISNSQGDDDHASSKPSASPHGHDDNNDALLAFWAPFLLLHLGGPDTITAFALEDNELWLRHLLGLIFQAVAAFYVFAQSLPKNRVWIPTVLTFVAGIIKYAERTRALYLASADRFRDSLLGKPEPGPNYAKIMEEYATTRDNKLPTQIIMIPETDKQDSATDVLADELNDLEVVYYGYKFFGIFKGLVVDHILSFSQREESRKFFRKREPDDALRVIEVELNFLYEAFYTKMEIVHCYWGYFFRSTAFLSILTAFGLFHSRTTKHDLIQFDVAITYTLLSGAIAMDVIALLMLIFSDRTFAAIKFPETDSWIFAKIFAKICSGILYWRRPWWREYKCKAMNPKLEDLSVEVTHNVLATPIVFRRWSGSLSSYNLISYCLKSHTNTLHRFTRWPLVIFENIASRLQIDKCYVFIVDLIKAVLKPFTKLLSGMIFILGFFKTKVSGGFTFVITKLKQITWLHHTIKVIASITYVVTKAKTGLHHIIQIMSKSCSAIITFIIANLGLKDFIDEFIYVSREPFTKELWKFIFEELKTKADNAGDPEKAKKISTARGEWVLEDSDTKIDLSTLKQYLTDVQYDESLLYWHIATDLLYYTPNEKIKVGWESFSYREFSKLLSDYMLYLLIMQPTMMSAVAGNGKIRFRDTCAEAKRFFDRRGLLSWPEKKKKTGATIEAQACEAILSVNTDVKPATVKGDVSKSVLFDASMLAQILNRLELQGLDKWKLMSRVWVELVSYAASNCRANSHAQQVSKGGEMLTLIWLLMAHFGLGEQFQINDGQARAKLIVGK